MALFERNEVMVSILEENFKSHLIKCAPGPFSSRSLVNPEEQRQTIIEAPADVGMVSPSRKDSNVELP
ncbi:hypothetical protein JCGZ_26480 [Jatropha curcas]|uniref:Uncharacterized protein n=1 Tax=Jatropha curcas TaxID=180498 RepID=A0A067LFT8_JATCU|nr:hypothetical protein JCGZ_26480 [Jatropha curcas]